MLQGTHLIYQSNWASTLQGRSLSSLGDEARTQSGLGSLSGGSPRRLPACTKLAFPSFWVTQLWLKRTSLCKAACVPAACCHPGEVGLVQINFPQHADIQRHDAPLFKVLGKRRSWITPVSCGLFFCISFAVCGEKRNQWKKMSLFCPFKLF